VCVYTVCVGVDVCITVSLHKKKIVFVVFPTLIISSIDDAGDLRLF
jgi:hypothetical protein